MVRLQAIRGMNDILPSQLPYWHFLEETFRSIADAYGYEEIRLPVLEATQLFVRSVGEVTDIVEKEMYTFEDRNGESLTLRPEGTAGCVRACLEHGLIHNQLQRLWYTGPMFRHERPQKGRYRQFHQIGVEVFGIESPDIDAELILMTNRLWSQLGLSNQVKLEINSLGSLEARAQYRTLLTEYFTKNSHELDEDSQRRLHTNPLRILDSKNPQMQSLIQAAPKLIDHIDDESKKHFDDFRRFLEAAGIAYQVNPRLVRGLDYYTRTVFEWVTDNLGAQGTVCAGGRYDGLVEQLGGRSTPAVGFAMGLERLISLLETQIELKHLQQLPDVYVISSGEQSQYQAFLLAERLREEMPLLRLIMNCGDGSFKTQFKRADKSGARVALIVGDEEVVEGKIGIKWLRETKEQELINLSDVIQFLTPLINY